MTLVGVFYALLWLLITISPWLPLLIGFLLGLFTGIAVRRTPPDAH